MKDRVFAGSDLAEALEAASQALGLPAGALRYVVLEEGRPGGRGVQGTPTRIAVMLEAAELSRGRTRADDDGPRLRLEAALRALAEAGRLDLGVQIDEGEGVLAVRFAGPDGSFVADGGEVQAALEHLLAGMVASCDPGLRLRVQPSLRDAGLTRTAQELARAVRTDGAPRETPPLNSYERRIVHVALAEEPGVRTWSVGEGAERRVRVAPSGVETEP